MNGFKVFAFRFLVVEDHMNKVRFLVKWCYSSLEDITLRFLVFVAGSCEADIFIWIYKETFMSWAEFNVIFLFDPCNFMFINFTRLMLLFYLLNFFFSLCDVLL